MVPAHRHFDPSRIVAFAAIAATLWLILSPAPLPKPWIAAFPAATKHVILFALLTPVCLRAWRERRPQHVLLALLGFSLLGEAAQGLVPRRAIEASDLAGNLAGIALGYLGTRALRRQRRPGQSPASR